MLASVRAKLGVVFLGFLLLVAGSTAATLVTLRAQATDALVINLAGRQRMLTQQISKAVLGYVHNPSEDYEAELRQAIDLFDRTLTALSDGGGTLYAGHTAVLPAATDKAIRAQLAVVADLWGSFREDIKTLQVGGADSAAQAVRDVELASPVILREMDRAVQLYEAAARTKLGRLRTIQALFTFGAGGLVVAGYLLTRRTIVHPLADLEQAARRIADGDLDSPVEVATGAGSEVGKLAASLEDMRRELADSRQRQERWTAELEARVEQRTAQLAALFEVSAEISSRLEIERVLDLIVDKTRALASGEVAILCLIDPSSQSLTVAATSGSPGAFAQDPQMDIKGCTLEGMTHTVEALIQHEGCHCPLLRPEFRHSHLAVPLQIGERILGGLCVGHREASQFHKEHERLLSLLALSGAIALENARSYAQAEQAATLVERERIVAEIHDGLAQTLSFLDLRLDVVQELIEDRDLSEVPEHLSLMRRTVEQSSVEVRRLLSGLQASVDPDRTLGGLLDQAVGQYAEERGMEVEVRFDGGGTARIPPHDYEQVVRVVLEALTNVHKHAGSARATVTLARYGECLAVCVHDDGPGFDTGGPSAEGYHFGLKVMQARAERIGGALSVQSAPGQGTTVTLSWPAKEG
jgi:two-component system nitrate/nitrite sensor histidine kinase NarX